MRLNICDKLFLGSFVTLVGLMNAFKEGLGRYLILGVFFFLTVAVVLPRIKVFVVFLVSLLSARLTKNEVVFSAYCFLIFVAYGRSITVPELVQSISVSLAFFIVVFALCFTLVRSAALRRDAEFIPLVLYSCHVFIIVNIVGYLIGFRGEIDFINSGDYGEAKLLALFGFKIGRVLFPFSPGLTTFGVVAGASFVVALVSFFEVKNVVHKWFNFFMIFVSAMALLLVDARGTIMFLMIALAVYAFLRIRDNIHLSSFVMLPLSFLFVALLFVVYFATSSGSEVGGELSRGGYLLSGREVVWISALSLIYEEPLSLVFGFGYMGQYISGASELYAFMFDSWGGESGFFSLHNFFLQMIFDMGVIGYMFFYSSLFLGVNKILRNSAYFGGYSVVVVMYFVYCIVSGTSESSVNVYSFLTFAPFLFVLGFVSQIYSCEKVDGHA